MVNLVELVKLGNWFYKWQTFDFANYQLPNSTNYPFQPTTF